MLDEEYMYLRPRNLSSGVFVSSFGRLFPHIVTKLMRSFLIKLILGLAVLTTLLVLGNQYFPFSNGDRTGELVKFSKKGVIFKTFEGEMSQGVSESTRWFFSVKKDNAAVIEKLNSVAGRSVTLTYLERYFTFPWISDTKYFITDVKINENVPSQDKLLSE